MPTVQARVSALNHAATATITASEAAGWPAANLRAPQQPFMEWHSPNLSLQTVVVDFGTPRLIELVLLVNVNFTAPGIDLIFENTLLGGGGPAVAPNITFNYWSRRYTYAWAPVPPGNHRYLRLQINTATTADALPYFHMGGIWAGPLLAIPRDIRWDEQMVAVEPLLDLQPPSHAWRQRLKMGDPYTVIQARRVAVSANGAAPGVNAELDQWIAVDHAMWFYDAFAWYSNRGNASHAWIVRRISESAWPIHQTVSEGDLVMEEITGP